MVPGTGLKTISIRRRLLRAYGFVLAVIILLFGTALVWGLNHSFNARLQSALGSVIFDIRHDVLTKRPALTGVLDPKEEYALSPVYIEVWALGSGAPQRVLSSANMRRQHLPLRTDPTEMFELYALPFISKEEKSALLWGPVEVGTKRYIITVAASIDKLDDLIEDFIEMFAFAGFVLYLIALYLGARLIDQVLLPMKSITGTAATISHGDLSRRVPLPDFHDEFFTLAQTFNAMLERIERGFERMKLFNANVSHELKTPLTIIRGETEVALRHRRTPEAYERVLDSIMEETASMQRIIEGILFLSRSDQETLQKSMVPVRFDEIVKEICAAYKAVADAKGVNLTLSTDEPVTINAEPQLLKAVLNNLVDNAVKYTPGGNGITVTLRKTCEHADLTIADKGIGIERDALAKLFDPFWREEIAHSKSVPGHGLGLSIAQWIVQAHRGSIKIDSEKNVGTVCQLRFELSEEPME